jgi:hypothetical protein
VAAPPHETTALAATLGRVHKSRDRVLLLIGAPALRLAQAAFLDEAGLKQAARLTRRAADAWSEVGVKPTVEHISAVERAEREALQAVEGSSIV